MTTIFRRLSICLIAVILLAGCAGQVAHREGLSLMANGHIEEGFDRLNTAIRLEPGNAEYRISFLQARDRTIAAWLEEGDRAVTRGESAHAERLYQRILVLDPKHLRAKAGLDGIARQARYKDLMAQADKAWAAGNAELALGQLRSILSEAPQYPVALALRQAIQEKNARPPIETKLSAGLKKPLSIEFKDTSLKQVFEVVARTSGLNFVFDKDVRTDQKTTIFLRDTTVQDAVSLVLLTNQLEQRILDKNSILIYPNTAAKTHDYQPLSVKSFFLSNSDVKAAANTLKTILKTKDLVVDERQNMLVMRDTPEALRLAEKLMALHDLPEPEVMLEVEILEVTRTRLLELGIRWPDQLTLTPLAAASGGTVTLEDLRHLPLSQVGATLAPLTINAKKQDGDANLLANPRIRTRSHESAKILIGERIPNITTTSTATGFVAETVQYVDVGLKLEVQPTIFPDNEITIKLSLEVSSIVNQVQTKSGTLAYQIGTRTASTVLRLRDGENQVLAGLINNEDRSAVYKIPGLGELPALGRLFGSHSDNALKTEIALSITPRLVRNLQRPTLLDSEFDSGTDASFRNFSPEAAPAPLTTVPGTIPPSAPVDASRARTIARPEKSDPAPATESTSLRWQGPAQVKVNDAFTAVLSIQPDQPLASIPYSISYDPKVLEVLAVSAGDFLKQGDVRTNFTNRVDRTSGQILVTETRPGIDGASAPGALATVTFRALAKAPSTQVQLLAIAPIGVDGRTVSTAPPPALVVTVQP